MAVDDLWYLAQRDPATGKRLPSKRHGRSKRWRVRNAGVPAQLFASKADAERADAAARADLARGMGVDPAAGRETVSSFGQRWRAVQVHRPTTAEYVERVFRLHVDPVLGRLPIAQVRPSHVQAWVKGLDLAPGTVRVAYSFVSSMFAAAVRDRVIGATPCVRVGVPAVDAHDRLILTPGAGTALAERQRPRHAPPGVRIRRLGAACGGTTTLQHGLVAITRISSAAASMIDKYALAATAVTGAMACPYTHQ